MKYYQKIITELNKEPDIDIPSQLLPWWRVVSSTGKISHRANSNGEVEQLRLLTSEGILYYNNCVDFDECGWFPDEIDL